MQPCNHAPCICGLRDILGCCCIIRMHASSGFRQRGTHHVMHPRSPVATFPCAYHFCYLGHYFRDKSTGLQVQLDQAQVVCQNPKIGTSREMPVFQNPKIGTFPKSENRHIFQNPKIGTFFFPSFRFAGFSSVVVRVRRIRCILAVFPPNFENSKTHRRRCPGVIAGYSRLFSRPLFSRPFFAVVHYSVVQAAPWGGGCRAGR